MAKKAEYAVIAKYGDEAAGKLWEEKTAYEDASKDIRATLTKAFRNYVSQYDQPKTKYDKREKVFVPLTETGVNMISSKVQVDVDAVSILPKNDNAVGQARVMEMLMKSQLDNLSFAELMDGVTFYKTLFGTAVTMQDWEYQTQITYQEMDKRALDEATMDEANPKVKAVKTDKVVKDTFRIKLIPLLDIFIDPTAESVHSASSVIIRTVNRISEIQNNKLYQNTDNLQPIGPQSDIYNNLALNKYITGASSNVEAGDDITELYHRYGRFPLEWVTGKDEDKELVEGIITVGNNAKGGRNVLCIRLLPFKHGHRPFEEDWYERVPHRWYGRGVGEKLIHLQRWSNENVNRRIGNAEHLQNQMFVIRRGANIDPRDLISRPAGSIKADDINNDIRELRQSDIQQSSYKDDDVIQQISEKLIGAFDIAFGGGSPDSATEAAIQSRNSGTTFNSVKRQTNNYLKRLIKDHLIPLDIQFMDTTTQVRIQGQQDELKQVDEVLGLDPEMANMLGNFRFITIDDMKLFDVDYDVLVDIDESMVSNKAIKAQQIKDALMMALSVQPNPDGSPRLRLNIDEMWKEYLNTIGLKGERFQLPEESMQPPQMMGQPQMGMPNEQMPNNPDISMNEMPDVPTGGIPQVPSQLA